MEKFTIDDCGKFGFVSNKDQRGYEATPQAWSSCRNIQFHNQAAQSVPAGECVFRESWWGQGDTTGRYITEAMVFNNETGKRWVVFGSTECFTLLMGSTGGNLAYCGDVDDHTKFVIHTEATPYPDNVWVADSMYGNIVATNGVSAPKYYPFDATPTTTTLSDLPGWTAHFGAGSYCKTLVAKKGFLLAGNIYAWNEHHPTRVSWSDQTQDVFGSGAQIPQSWDAADPTKLAGSVWLPTNSGAIRAMKALRDDIIVYCENAIYRVMFVGGSKIFDYREVFTNQGIFGPKCVQEFDGKHFFVGVDDILVFDGQSVSSVAKGRTRRFLFDLLTEDDRNIVDVAIDRTHSEMLVTYRDDKSRKASNAMLVWSWDEGTWSQRQVFSTYPIDADPPFGGPGSDEWEAVYSTIIRELPVVTDGSATTTFDEAQGTFDEAQGLFDSPIEELGELASFNFGGYLNVAQELPEVFIQKMRRAYRSYWMGAGEDVVAELERTGIQLTDDSSAAVVLQVVPRFDSEVPVEVYIGSANNTDEEYVYKGPYTLLPDSREQFRVNTRVRGRRHAIKFRASGGFFRLYGYDLVYVKSGER